MKLNTEIFQLIIGFLFLELITIILLELKV